MQADGTPDPVAADVLLIMEAEPLSPIPWPMSAAIATPRSCAVRIPAHVVAGAPFARLGIASDNGCKVSHPFTRLQTTLNLDVTPKE